MQALVARPGFSRQVREVRTGALYRPCPLALRYGGCFKGWWASTYGHLLRKRDNHRKSGFLGGNLEDE